MRNRPSPPPAPPAASARRGRERADVLIAHENTRHAQRGKRSRFANRAGRTTLSRPMSAHEFSIPVSELDAAGKSYRFPVRVAWLRGALEGVGPSGRAAEVTATGTDGELDVRASKSGNDVVVHGRVKAEVTTPCARCLEPATIRVDQPLSVLMVPEKAAARGKGSDKSDKDEYEFTTEEADVVPFDGETVVLDDVVRDEILLEIPMIPLCSEDCPGMSASPEPEPEGKAEAKGIDPRLAPLLRLQKLTKE